METEKRNLQISNEMIQQSSNIGVEEALVFDRCLDP